MMPLSVLPVFLRLAGARAVFAGNGEPAAWKLELLAATGADIAAFAPEPGDKLREAAERVGVALAGRPWREEDLAGARLAILETQDDDEAARFQAAGRAAGALVNVIDRPRFCDFSFGAIVERSPLVIGVSTDGAAPILGMAARARIEAMFPDTLRAWAQAARAWRPRFSALPPAQRRALWRDFAQTAFASIDRAPEEADCRRLLDGRRAGRLVVVGTGAGRADDLTLRAVRALQAADWIVADRVDLGLADLGRREANRESFPAGADSSARAAVAARVEAGATVVVLVAGDGRGADWAGAEIVAGVAS